MAETEPAAILEDAAGHDGQLRLDRSIVRKNRRRVKGLPEEVGGAPQQRAHPDQLVQSQHVIRGRRLDLRPRGEPDRDGTQSVPFRLHRRNIHGRRRVAKHHESLDGQGLAEEGPRHVG